VVPDDFDDDNHDDDDKGNGGLMTNSIEQISSREADRSSSTQEIPRIL
jgi:hypothetical protein